jgi:hypothetical protein
MVSDKNKLAQTTRSDPEPSGAAAGSPPEPAPGDPEVELALADLVADAYGEIVLFNDSGFRSLMIRTERAVVADGHADSHVTAAGDDVSGFQFVTFDNGLTLYFEPGLHLILPNTPATSP